ncbi:exopolysaccharide Pel transporter PelG [Ectobacillus panaciterrae]|uniref:exopolysaccharide Pel transporter PelG n=1 Tax=Ectobacillus panaciterrae TaxID=363872 RepID=UPI00048BB80A|nr:exopolysaccharide Pel transporter PelG [Ectobacillus panaciterrae]
MAGIGFTLQKALGSSKSVSKKWRLYGAATFVVAGPWVLTLTSLFILYFWSNHFGMTKEQRDLFFATVTYATMGSSLISNLAQLFLTRYLADALYVKSHDRLLSGFTSIFVYCGTTALIGSTIGQLFLPLTFSYRIWTVVLTVTLTLLWLLMILLSAAKAYRDIARGFLVGIVVQLIVIITWSVWVLKGGPAPNPTRILAVYTIGLGLTFLWIGGVVIRDFSGRIPALFDIRQQYKCYPELLWIGLFYGLTLWVDNIVYWFSDIQVKVSDSYLLAPSYDSAKFLTLLAFIPSFVVFSIKIETNFYQVYRQFYDSIERGANLAQIQIYEEELRTLTKKTLFRIARIQTVTAVLGWVIAQQFTITYHEVIEIFQWTIIGSIMHMTWITVFLLLLYFDARKSALWSVSLGLLALFITTEIAKYMQWPIGTGYLLGTILMLLIGLLLLNQHLKRLLYHSFFNTMDRSLPPAAQLMSKQQKIGFPVIQERSQAGKKEE